MGCRSTADQADYEQMLIAEADSITTVVQQQIMKNLINAIETGGVAYAVDFCNAEAVSLTHSAAGGFRGTVQRISDKNRNPDNALQTAVDKQVFEHFRKFAKAKDSLVLTDDKYVYYKRINLAMPTCMNCHGAPANIEPGVLAAIDKHYPDDKAKGYELNQLRGLWKLVFE